MTTTSRRFDRRLPAALVLGLVAVTPAHAGLLGRALGKGLTRSASRTAVRGVVSGTASRSATRSAGGGMARGLARRWGSGALSGAKRAAARLGRLNPLRRVRLGRFSGTTMGTQGKGVAAVRNLGRRSLRPGEKIAGVHHVWYRTSSGRVIRAQPNRFQTKAWETAQAKLRGSETIVGVEGAGFLTSTGRVMRIFPGVGTGGKALMKLRPAAAWAKFVAFPAAAGFTWSMLDRVILFTGAGRLREQTDRLIDREPQIQPEGGEGTGAGTFGQDGGTTVIQIDGDGDGGPERRTEGVEVREEPDGSVVIRLGEPVVEGPPVAGGE